MKLRASLSMLALAAVTTAVAQTPTPAPAPAPATTPRHKATSTSGPGILPKNIPAVHGVLHTAYSLKYIDTKLGTGELATPGKFYTVHYTGWLAKDGKKFDSSYDHPNGGQPITFQVGMRRVIPGWDTGFAGMHVGGKRRILIPYQLAYGELGSPVRPGRPQDIPPKSDLIFDVELISISDKPPLPPKPSMPPPGSPGAPGKPMTPGTPPPATPPASGAPPSGTTATPPAAATPPPAAAAPATPPPATTAAPATPPPAPKPATPPQ